MVARAAPGLHVPATSEARAPARSARADPAVTASLALSCAVHGAIAVMVATSSPAAPAAPEQAEQARLPDPARVAGVQRASDEGGDEGGFRPPGGSGGEASGAGLTTRSEMEAKRDASGEEDDASSEATRRTAEDAPKAATGDASEPARDETTEEPPRAPSPERPERAEAERDPEPERAEAERNPDPEPSPENPEASPSATTRESTAPAGETTERADASPEADSGDEASSGAAEAESAPDRAAAGATGAGGSAEASGDGPGGGEGEGPAGPGSGSGEGSAGGGDDGVDRAALRQGYAKRVSAAVGDTYRYPRIARRAELEGRVVVGIRVDAEGEVRSCEILDSSGHEVLDEAALESVREIDDFPAPPAELAWGVRTIPVPFVYELRKGS